MATVEHSPTGKKVIRYRTGKQPLLVISEKLQGVLWLSTNDEVIRLQRHWDDKVQCTEACRCNPLCASSRTDRLVAVLLQVDRTIYEERLLILPEDAWRCVERDWLLKHQDHEDLRGAGCLIRRVGSRRNGRTTCSIQEWAVDHVPQTFSVGEAARQQMHVATDFFQMGSTVEEVDQQTITPARARLEKPRVPLGRPPRR